MKHNGVSFKAGQFAWLTVGDTPFTLQQHPFSFTSSEERSDYYCFTIKELGDFSSDIKSIKKGTSVYLEGPYGAFTLNPDIKNAFFIIGGIGITPVISMLRTLRDRGDERPLILICGPEPMMDLAESSLRFWDVPVYKVHSERFNIV